MTGDKETRAPAAGAPRGPRPPTIADVARQAGVSVGTVSHFLSGARQLRPQTRRRVEHAVRELAFRPNLVARSLTRRRTMTVGMVVPDIVNPIFAELIRGTEDALMERGYALLFGSSDNRLEKERRYLGAFVERQVDGIVLDATGESTSESLQETAAVVPLVVVDRFASDWPGDRVRSDDEYGMGLAVDHLVALGHRSIALLSGEPTVAGAMRRRRGFERALERHGLVAAWISEGTFTIPSGRMQTRGMLAAPTRPTAVCAGNDLLAMAVLAEVGEHGISVPSQMSVVGYDDFTFAQVTTPALTTVSQPFASMGSTAGRLLLQRLEGPVEPAQEIILRGELVVRASTAAAPE